MFISELELFSIGTISLPLKPVNLVIVNTIQIEKTTKSSYFGIILNIEINHKVAPQIIINKELEIALEDEVYPKTYCCIELDTLIPLAHKCNID